MGLVWKAKQKLRIATFYLNSDSRLASLTVNSVLIMGCLIPKGILARVGVLFPSHPCHQHVCAFTAYDQERIKAQNGAQIYQNYWVF